MVEVKFLMSIFKQSNSKIKREVETNEPENPNFWPQFELSVNPGNFGQAAWSPPNAAPEASSNLLGAHPRNPRWLAG
jgi:hypothetical protein